MPPIQTAARKQTAQYWPVGGVDEYGRNKRGTKVELKVRWKYVNKEALDPQGNTITVDAEAVVDRVIPVGGFMWLGDEWDMPGTALVPDTDVMVIVAYRSTPDIKGRATRHTVSLQRYADSLPSA